MTKLWNDEKRCPLYTSTLEINTTSADERNNVNVELLCNKLDSIEMTKATSDGAFNIATHAHTEASREIKGHFNTLPAILQDCDGDTCLHNAIILLKSDQATHFINIAKSPEQIYIKNNLGLTSLHLAVLTNQTSVARRLIVGGADIESRDRNGNTALHIACREGFVGIAMTLLKPVRYIETKQNSYDIPYQKIPQNLELTNYEGKNCLHLAASNDYNELAELLIENGANINSKDLKTGRTILHSASLDGNINLVKLLLQYPECELNAKTYDGHYPFDLARVRGNYDIIRALAVAGAQYEDWDEEME